MRALSALALAFLGAAPRTGLLRLRFASPAVRGRLAGVRACASAASVWDEGAGAGEAEPLAKPATVNELDQNVAVNNGDRWSGERATVDELRAICDEATSTREPLPIIPQWLPTPDWLWKQWRGTIVRHVLPRDVLVVTLFALGIVLFFHAPGVHSIYRKSLIRHLIAVERVWGLASGLVSFTLSFFLTQSYTFWREVYVIVRQVQGRLNDLGLLLAASAARDADGQYTAQSEELLALTNAPHETSHALFRPDRLAVSPRIRNALYSVRMGDGSDRTVGEHFVATSRFINEIEEAWELQGILGDNVDGVLAYRDDQQGIELVMPQGVTQLPLQTDGLDNSVVNYASVGGVMMRNPLNNILGYVTAE